jgi:hypothetical protein
MKKYTIVLVDPFTFSISHTKGVFDSVEDAILHAEEDRECEKDYHWSVIPVIDVNAELDDEEEASNT